MGQIGCIVIGDSVNTQAIIDSLKEDKKISIGKEQVTEDGVRYIPIEKNGWFMSSWLIALTGCIYFYVALEQGYKGNIGMLITYIGYAFANIGLYLLASK